MLLMLHCHALYWLDSVSNFFNKCPDSFISLNVTVSANSFLQEIKGFNQSHWEYSDNMITIFSAFSLDAWSRETWHSLWGWIISRSSTLNWIRITIMLERCWRVVLWWKMWRTLKLEVSINVGEVLKGCIVVENVENLKVRG